MICVQRDRIVLLTGERVSELAPEFEVLCILSGALKYMLCAQNANVMRGHLLLRVYFP
jgi:hypothetical protein